MYKRVEIEDNDSIKTNEKNKKIIFYEYYFHTIIALSLIIYLMIDLCKTSHKFAEKYNFKLDGLVKGYSFLGGYRDFSDFQWRYYRENLPVLLIFATIFVSINKIIKMYSSLEILKLSYLIFGLGYAFFLHRIKIIYLLIVLIFSYALCLNYSLLGKKTFVALTWIFCIIIKITSEIYDGYSIDFLNISDFYKNPLLGWNSCFGLIMLKIISFNIEFSSSIDNNNNNNVKNINKIMEHCKECNKRKFCITALKKLVTTSEDDYSFINLLIYIFYPPFYFSGPIIMYHSFIFQINNYKINRHNDLNDKNKILYFIRCVLIFITFEVFNHYVYINAIMTNKYNTWAFEEYKKDMSYIKYFYLCLNNLVFVFIKFSLIWKVARLWGWTDGILSEENMNRCIYNNYSFEGFWRQWHRSYNMWLIRYMYIPLGGAKTKIFNSFIIFSFVALWHDLRFNLLLWAWCIYISLIPEIIIKSYFSQEKRQYLNNYMLFRYLRAAVCSISIMSLITANLIGFGIGNKELVDALLYFIKKSTPSKVIMLIIFIMPYTFVMFFIRELERMRGINNNF